MDQRQNFTGIICIGTMKSVPGKLFSTITVDKKQDWRKSRDMLCVCVFNSVAQSLHSGNYQSTIISKYSSTLTTTLSVIIL